MPWTYIYPKHQYQKTGGMLKGTTTFLTVILTKLFRLLIKPGKIPQKWKISSVVPIPKIAKDADNLCNYMTISLLLMVSK